MIAACAGPAIRPAVSPAPPRRDALVILPGFGYGKGDDASFRAVAESAAAEGIDVYVARYLTRGSLDASRDRLVRVFHEDHLDRYERVHVFSFIAGAWTLNPAIERGALPNLATVIYDRSPYQERALALAVRDLRVPAWLRYGSTLFDVARAPYPPLTRPGVLVGLLVETTPTSFIQHRARRAEALGGFDFACAAFDQRHDDCAYVAMNHDELYARFSSVWPDVKAFIRTGRYGDGAVRTAPADPSLPLSRR